MALPVGLHELKHQERFRGWVYQKQNETGIFTDFFFLLCSLLFLGVGQVAPTGGASVSLCPGQPGLADLVAPCPPLPFNGTALIPITERLWGEGAWQPHSHILAWSGPMDRRAW